MTKVLLSLVASALITFTQIHAVHAANFSGRIFVVQNTSQPGVLRFFANTPTVISLFASGDFKDVLLQAFFHKANVDVSYTPITCLDGITPPCGTVTSVSVNTTTF